MKNASDELAQKVKSIKLKAKNLLKETEGLKPKLDNYKKQANQLIEDVKNGKFDKK